MLFYNTALHIICRDSDNIDCFKLLLSCGRNLNINIKNKKIKQQKELASDFNLKKLLIYSINMKLIKKKLLKNLEKN